MIRINEDDVRRQLEAVGLLLPPGSLEVAKGGVSRRCKTADQRDSQRRGWYRLSEWQTREGLMIIGTFGWFEGDNPNTQKVELSKRCDACGFEAPFNARTCPSCGKKAFADRGITPEELKAMRARQAEDAKRAAAERKAEAEHAARWAAAVWRVARPAQSGDHDYLARKGLANAHGARILDSVEGIELDHAEPGDLEYLAHFVGALIVPLCDERGGVQGLQFILSRERHAARIRAIERDKEYWPSGMAKQGRYHLIGEVASGGVVLVAEGYATAASLHEASGLAVAVAFDAGNLAAVLAALVKRYRKSRFLVCADDDWLQKCAECKTPTPVDTDTCTHCGKPHRKQNAGVKRATEAALTTDRAAWVAPLFAQPRPADKKGPTDYNDLAVLEGLAVVRAQVETALAAHRWDAVTPPRATSTREPIARGEGGARLAAVSSMSIDDLAVRFRWIDDDTGEFAFDEWTRNVVKLTKVIKLLAPGDRFDDLKQHPRWRKSAVYIDQIGFDPGNEDANIVCNRFNGWPLAPKQGQCGNTLELLRYLASLEKNSGEIYEWMLRWLAYPLQHPGAKMRSALVVHGPQGTGKSMVFEAIAKLYGEYGIVLNQGAIEDKFNADWSERKLYIVADEIVARGELHHLKNQLKNFITGEWVRVNPKNVAAHRERNHMNIVFCSNEEQPVVLDNDDRRHLVLWTPPKLEPEFYAIVDAELTNGGLQALYHHLLNLDLGDFKPWTLPPMTRAKADLIAIGASSVDRFLTDWKTGDIEGIPYCPAGSADLYRVYLDWCRANGEKFPRTSAQFVGRVSKLPGWRYGHLDRYDGAHSTLKVRQRFVVPAPEDLAQAFDLYRRTDARQPEGQSQTQWLTTCWVEFSEAARRGKGSDA